MPCEPASIWRSTRRSRAASSMRPFLKGVTSGVTEPCIRLRSTMAPPRVLSEGSPPGGQIQGSVYTLFGEFSVEEDMTLGELLEHPGLKLKRLGGEAGLSRRVRGVQVVEFPEEAQGLEPGSLALTTGLWMGRHPDRQRAFAAALGGRALALGLHEGAVIP
ncbi:MAG: hypothetical protein C4333_07480, partial [Meiothermus sp.]